MISTHRDSGGIGAATYCRVDEPDGALPGRNPRVIHSGKHRRSGGRRRRTSRHELHGPIRDDSVIQPTIYSREPLASWTRTHIPIQSDVRVPPRHTRRVEQIRSIRRVVAAQEPMHGVDLPLRDAEGVRESAARVDVGVTRYFRVVHLPYISIPFAGVDAAGVPFCQTLSVSLRQWSRMGMWPGNQG